MIRALEYPTTKLSVVNCIEFSTQKLKINVANKMSKYSAKKTTRFLIIVFQLLKFILVLVVGTLF